MERVSGGRITGCGGIISFSLVCEFLYGAPDPATGGSRDLTPQTLSSMPWLHPYEQRAFTQQILAISLLSTPQQQSPSSRKGTGSGETVLRIRVWDPVPFWPLDQVSGIRCPFWPLDPGSEIGLFQIPDHGWIPNPYFWELSHSFWGKKYYNSL